MLIVTACIIFGIYSFISSRKLHKSIADNSEFGSNNLQRHLKKNDFSVLNQQNMSDLKIIVKSIEDTSSLNTHYLSEIQNRLAALEAAGNYAKTDEYEKWDNAEEDWEKLYYETKKEKKLLEDELETVNGVLQTNTEKLLAVERQHVELTAAKSNIALKVEEVQFLQNTINKFQQKLTVATEREKELEQQVAHEKFRYLEYESLQKHNQQLHTEIAILTDNFSNK